MRKSKKLELHAKLDWNKLEEILSALERKDELNRKHLQQRKTKKFNYLKFTPKNQISFGRKRRNHSHKKRTNEHYKLSYAAALKRKRSTNLRRKFSKQNLAKNKQNNSVKKPILNANSSHSTSSNTPADVSAAKQTENNKNYTFQNEIEILKKETESLKKKIIHEYHKFPPDDNYFRTHHQYDRFKN